VIKGQDHAAEKDEGIKEADLGMWIIVEVLWHAYFLTHASKWFVLKESSLWIRYFSTWIVLLYFFLPIQQGKFFQMKIDCV
jgi:hypothetical protein